MFKQIAILAIMIAVSNGLLFYQRVLRPMEPVAVVYKTPKTPSLELGEELEKVIISFVIISIIQKCHEIFQFVQFRFELHQMTQKLHSAWYLNNGHEFTPKFGIKIVRCPYSMTRGPIGCIPTRIL